MFEWVDSVWDTLHANTSASQTATVHCLVSFPVASEVDGVHLALLHSSRTRRDHDPQTLKVEDSTLCCLYSQALCLWEPAGVMRESSLREPFNSDLTSIPASEHGSRTG